MTTDKSPTGIGSGGADDGDDLEMMQVTHDHLLKESVRITQPVDGYRVGSDAVLLAASINTEKGRILDLGTGVGGVAFASPSALQVFILPLLKKTRTSPSSPRSTSQIMGLLAGHADQW